MHAVQQATMRFLSLQKTEQYYIVVAIFLSLLFVAASIRDIQKREIPVVLWSIAGAFAIFAHHYFKTGYTEFIIAAAFLVVWYFFQALFFSGGGGDIIMMGVFGFCIGIVGTLVTVIASTVFLGIYCIIYRIRYKRMAPPEYPLAPFIALGFVVYLVLSYTGVLAPYTQTVQWLFR